MSHTATCICLDINQRVQTCRTKNLQPVLLRPMMLQLWLFIVACFRRRRESGMPCSAWRSALSDNQPVICQLINRGIHSSRDLNEMRLPPVWLIATQTTSHPIIENSNFYIFHSRPWDCEVYMLFWDKYICI